MGKANWIIISLGLAACVALSLIMRQALAVKKEKETDPVVKEVYEVFGSRLQGQPSFAVETRDDTKVGVLTIRPRFRVAVQHTANMLGRFVWHQCADSGRFRELEILALGEEGEQPKPYKIRRPFVGELPEKQSVRPPAKAASGQPGR